MYILKLSAVGVFISLLVTACSDVKYEETPYVAPVTSLTANVTNRTVTLSWNLPAGEISGVQITRNADYNTRIVLDGAVSSYSMPTQPMDEDLLYTVKAMYADGTVSEGVTVNVRIPFAEAKMGFLLNVASPTDLTDDDERAAAEWFAAQSNAEFLTVSQLATADPDVMPVVWIEIDRNGTAPGWENLPAEFSSDEAISAMRSYTSRGGNLFLANMATQLTVPLGFVADQYAPGIFGSGDGGWGDDVWVINPHLGWDFREDPGNYYDRAEHAVFAGITLEDPNNYGYSTVPLIGPGQREDHNCCWDCNAYGFPRNPDVIRDFEVATNSLVLATWGHVRDHCVAGMVEFYANASHGRCIAMGLAAYEWNQNSGTNPYQGNIERLTSNILNYLK